MNDTASSAPGASLLPDSTDLITGIHLGLLVIIALLAVAVIVWGARLKHRRKAAEAELRAHNEEVAGPAAAPATADDGTVHPTAAAAAAESGSPATPAAPPAPTDATPPASPPLSTGAADGSVTQLKGLGPKVASRLAELGITTVGHLATLDAAAAARLDADLAPFSGRMARDRWIEQARFLAAGDKPGFEAVFGRL